MKEAERPEVVVKEGHRHLDRPVTKPASSFFVKRVTDPSKIITEPAAS